MLKGSRPWGGMLLSFAVCLGEVDGADECPSLFLVSFLLAFQSLIHLGLPCRIGQMLLFSLTDGLNSGQ